MSSISPPTNGAQIPDFDSMSTGEALAYVFLTLGNSVGDEVRVKAGEVQTSTQSLQKATDALNNVLAEKTKAAKAGKTTINWADLSNDTRNFLTAEGYTSSASIEASALISACNLYSDKYNELSKKVYLDFQALQSRMSELYSAGSNCSVLFHGIVSKIINGSW